MTEADLKEFLEENKAEIQSTIKARVIDRILEQHRWDITGQIAKVVDEFVSTEIVPEVKKHLADNKGPILEAAIAGASTIGDTLAKALVEQAAKRLDANSYQFRDITKALFG